MVHTSSTMTTRGPFAAEAFDAASCAVSLFGLADQKSVKQGAPGCEMCAPGAGRGHIRDDGIGAHSEAADSFGIDLVGLQQFEDGVAG